MFFFIKLIKKTLKAVNSNAGVWQIWLGAFIGVLLGFLPVWPKLTAPSFLGLALIAFVVFINIHLGSVFLFMGIGKALALALRPVADATAPKLEGLAESMAGNAFLHGSHLSHTGYLSLAIMGAVVAFVLATGMGIFTVVFRTRLREKLVARKKLITAGKVVGSKWTWRLAGWFFDL